MAHLTRLASQGDQLVRALLPTNEPAALLSPASSAYPTALLCPAHFSARILSLPNSALLCPARFSARILSLPNSAAVPGALLSLLHCV